MERKGSVGNITIAGRSRGLGPADHLVYDVRALQLHPQRLRRAGVSRRSLRMPFLLSRTRRSRSPEQEHRSRCHRRLQTREHDHPCTLCRRQHRAGGDPRPARMDDPGREGPLTRLDRDRGIQPADLGLVGARGFEPLTSSVSGKRSPTELSARGEHGTGRSGHVWRRGPELNRCRGFCRPLPNHSATPPNERPGRPGTASLREPPNEPRDPLGPSGNERSTGSERATPPRQGRASHLTLDSISHDLGFRLRSLDRMTS
jgi:hypothetical protein